ncbi:MAG: L-threonine 3-dehydrogenase [Defluviitaleaceae bacterium]|nr:L-threonine 3-dehydrogenase [Defluviitaleaceae bacterium]
MNAILKNKPTFGGLELLEVDIPKIKDDEVLVKMKKTAICGTDINIYEWKEWAQRTIKTPMIIGHEFVGIVEEVGKNVKRVKKGQLVTGEGHLVCGVCRNCLKGGAHLCRETVGIGVNKTGIFAEYAAIPEANIWAIENENIPLNVISCFDPLGNAVHTALSFDLVGEDILITGAGPIGLMAVAIAKHCGARNIIVTDVIPHRLEMAKKMGATAVIDVRTEKIEDCFPALGIKEGIDVGLEMSGNPHAFRDMVRVMHHGGKIGLLGLIPQDTVINWDDVIFKCLEIKGIYGREMFETWYKMTAMVGSGLDITPVITHEFDYKDFEKAFETMMSGQSGKVILNWEA